MAPLRRTETGADFLSPQLPVTLMPREGSRCAKARGSSEDEEEAMDQCREATLSEILSDPIVLIVMAADGVDPHDFESNLRKADSSRRLEGEDRHGSDSA
jgi:hypothetical protein